MYALFYIMFRYLLQYLVILIIINHIKQSLKPYEDGPLLKLQKTT